MAALLKTWTSIGFIPPYTTWNCGGFLADFIFECNGGVLLLEYDEQMHSDRNKRCELVRQANISLAYQGRPVHWIRFNPDAFKVDGEILPQISLITSKEEREAVLLALIQAALKFEGRDNFITIDYVCYDKPQAAIPPSPMGDLVQTFKFKTIEDYSAWVDAVAPESADQGQGGSAESSGGGC